MGERDLEGSVSSDKRGSTVVIINFCSEELSTPPIFPPPPDDDNFDNSPVLHHEREVHHDGDLDRDPVGLID